MPRGTGRAVLITLAATLLVGVGAVLLFAWSGVYNIAATDPHAGPVAWLLHTTKERSIEVHADGVGDPPELTPEDMEHAWQHFGEMCAVCHGAPGEERGEIGKGLNPEPPLLEDVAAEFTSREIFWIVKHGIKLAGMPAFGPTHQDRDLWAMVRVVERLPETTAEEYRRLSGRAAADSAAASGEQDASATGGHTHAPGTPAHEH